MKNTWNVKIDVTPVPATGGAKIPKQPIVLQDVVVLVVNAPKVYTLYKVYLLSIFDK